MGTIIVSILLISIITLIIVSIIKEKRSGRHPSCGGNCGSCSQICKAAYPHSSSFLDNQKKIRNNNSRKTDNNK